MAIRYYQGRFSNGPLTVEVLAERPKDGLKSLAVAAALSGQGNLNLGIESLKGTGLLGQIDQFEKELNGAKAVHLLLTRSHYAHSIYYTSLVRWASLKIHALKSLAFTSGNFTRQVSLDFHHRY